MAKEPTILGILKEMKKDFKEGLGTLKMDLSEDIGELKSETNKLREDHYALASQVGAAVRDMQNTRTILSKHLDKHWQAYIALSIPIIAALVGVVINWCK